jgi:ABC-type transport system involved in multi-copper enzyme maturation permease subunit
MSAQWKCLLTKEWSQRRRWFWYCTFIMLYLLGYCVAYEFEYRTRAFIAAFYSSCLVFSMVGSILISMGTVTGEYSERTLKFTASLPVSLFKVGWARLIMAWGCLVGPIVIAAIITTLILISGAIEQAELRPADYIANPQRISLPKRPSLSTGEAIAFLWRVTAVAVCIPISLVTLISLLGTWCRKEGSVGFLGVILILIVMLCVPSRSFSAHEGFNWVGSIVPQSLANSWGYGEKDGSTYSDLELAPDLAGPLATNFLISLILGSLFARNYGRRSEVGASAKRVRRWPQMPRLMSRVPIRWPGRLAALIWLDARQSVLLCVTGLVLASLMTLVSLRSSYSFPTVGSRFAKQLPENTWMIGIVWGAIVAIGVFGSETKAQLEEFWRTRPISPRQWFWVKYIVGLMALLITLDLLPALGLWSLGHRRDVGSGYLEMGLSASLFCLPLLHAQTYAFAAAAICLTCRPILGAVIGIILSQGANLLLESVPVYPKWSTMEILSELNSMEAEREPVDFIKSGYPFVYGSVAAMTLIATLLAGRTIRPETGRRIVWAATVLIGFCGTAAFAEEAVPQFAKDVAAEIEKRVESIHDLRLKLSTEIHRTGNLPLTSDGQKNAKLVAQKPSDERFNYEYVQQGKQRAWTKYNLDGSVHSALSFDGTIQSTYEPPDDSIVMATSNQQIRFPHPFSMLYEELNLSTSTPLDELLKTQPVESIKRYEVDGEQMIDLVIHSPARTEDNFTEFGQQKVDFMGHRMVMTINATHQYWPIKIEVDYLSTAEGRVAVRYETIVTGWVPNKSFDFPRAIRQVVSRPRRNADGSDATPLEFLVTEIKQCEVLELAINEGLPDTAFASPIPAGVPYYDMRTRENLVHDESGQIRPYLYRPRGVQGAVFGYLATSAAAAIVYLFWRTSLPFGIR